MKRQKTKKNVVENRTSFNELHKIKLDEFENLFKLLPAKKKKLNKLRAKTTTTWPLEILTDAQKKAMKVNPLVASGLLTKDQIHDLKKQQDLKQQQSKIDEKMGPAPHPQKNQLLEANFVICYRYWAPLGALKIAPGAKKTLKKPRVRLGKRLPKGTL